MMRIRLRLLLVNFNKAVVDYALARLEVALANPASAAPPVINRLGPHVQLDGFAACWPAVLSQVGAAADFIAAGNRGDLGVKRDRAWLRLARSAKIVGQLAESIEWVGAEPRAGAPGDEGG